MSKCPVCGSEAYYVGFTTIECKNPMCKHFLAMPVIANKSTSVATSSIPEYDFDAQMMLPMRARANEIPCDLVKKHADGHVSRLRYRYAYDEKCIDEKYIDIDYVDTDIVDGATLSLRARYADACVQSKYYGTATFDESGRVIEIR